MRISKVPWHRRLRHSYGLLGRLQCLIGLHDWDMNCNGCTGDEWTACHRCLKAKRGSLEVWAGKEVGMRPATREEMKDQGFPI